MSTSTILRCDFTSHPEKKLQTSKEWNHQGHYALLWNSVSCATPLCCNLSWKRPGWARFSLRLAFRDIRCSGSGCNPPRQKSNKFDCKFNSINMYEMGLRTYIIKRKPRMLTNLRIGEIPSNQIAWPTSSWKQNGFHWFCLSKDFQSSSHSSSCSAAHSPELGAGSWFTGTALAFAFFPFLPAPPSAFRFSAAWPQKGKTSSFESEDNMTINAKRSIYPISSYPSIYLSIYIYNIYWSKDL